MEGSGGGSGSTPPRIADGVVMPSARRVSQLRFDTLGGPLPSPRKIIEPLCIGTIGLPHILKSSTTVDGVVLTASLGHATPRGSPTATSRDAGLWLPSQQESGRSTPIPRASSSSSCATSSHDSVDELRVDLSSLDLRSVDAAAPLSSDITAVHSPAASPAITPSHPPHASAQCFQWVPSTHEDPRPCAPLLQSGNQMQIKPAPQAFEDQACEHQASGLRRRNAPPETPEVCEISEECPTEAREQAPPQGQCLVINGTVMDGKAGLPAEATRNYGALVRFMGNNRKNLAIVVQCLTVMGISATSPANRVKCFRSGCADAVVKCLREYKDQALVQEYGIWVLSMLSYERRISMMIASLDGIKMACKAMQAFPKVETLQQRAGWFLLVQLSWRHPAVLKSMEKRGVPQLLSDARCNFADCKLLEQVAVDCLAILQGRQVAQPLFALDKDAAAFPVNRRRQGAFS